jgi:tetratricopeptide (TPR) repeat protein
LFPWPVVAVYDDIHRWMDAGQAIHAAWQVRDAWEGLIKFLGTLAVADHLATAPPNDPHTSLVLARLLKPQGLSMGDWPTLMELTLKEGLPPGARLPDLAPLLFPARRPKLLPLIVGDKNSFVYWRNRRFGHGVFAKDESVFVEEASEWLQKLHEAYVLCRPLFTRLNLESDGLNGELLTWGAQSPLPFYHTHQSAAARQALPPVRVRLAPTEPLLLSPLLTVQRCEVCGRWAAFYLDKYELGKQRAWFLDFLEGHSRDRKDLEPLRSWAARLRDADTPAGGAEPPGAAERREPDPERFVDFLQEFEPPVYLARQAAAFLNSVDRGVIVLTGPAGVGKSWVSQGLGHSSMLPAVLGRAIPMLHVSVHGPRAPTAAGVKTELAELARKDKRWQVPAEPDAPATHARFAGWLAALMRANGHGELLVSLDGLDELPADSDVPELLPPANELARGCYLILSSRPAQRAAAEAGLRRVRTAVAHVLEMKIGPEEGAHRAVLSAYVEKYLARRRPDDQPPLPAAWGEPLLDLAQGSFLYVFHYCRALHFGFYRDLTQLPPPDAYYPAFFAHVRTRVGDELFEGCYARVLALLAVAREPLGLTHLTAWGLERTRLIVVLDDLADLLRSRRQPWDTETLYELGHDTLRQFLAADAAWQARLAEADRFLAGLTVERFGADWSAADPFDPVESYLLFHLLDHATVPEMRQRILADANLANACLDHGNTLYKQGRYERCLQAYEMAVSLLETLVQREGRSELRPDLASAYLNRGVTLDSLGRLEEALASYAACIQLRETLVQREGRTELAGDLAWAYAVKANVLLAMGQRAEAAQLVALAIEILREEVARTRRADLQQVLAFAEKVRDQANG